jgi:hypothetical protein
VGGCAGGPPQTTIPWEGVKDCLTFGPYPCRKYGSLDLSIFTQRNGCGLDVLHERGQLLLKLDSANTCGESCGMVWIFGGGSGRPSSRIGSLTASALPAGGLFLSGHLRVKVFVPYPSRCFRRKTWRSLRKTGHTRPDGRMTGCAAT